MLDSNQRSPLELNRVRRIDCFTLEIKRASECFRPAKLMGHKKYVKERAIAGDSPRRSDVCRYVKLCVQVFSNTFDTPLPLTLRPA